VRIARVAHGDAIAFAVLEDEFAAEIEGSPIPPIRFTGSRVALAECRLLAPVLPSKIVAVARNYVEHAAELGNEVPAEPMIFLKPSTAVIGPEDVIRKPDGIGRIDFEGELCLVMAGLVRRADAEAAAAGILGYTCGNDVSARELQKRDGQWGRAKGFDSFAPLGPWIETTLEPAALRIETRLNGVVKQEGNTKDMVFSPAQLVSWISNVMTLLPGDVIMTGTPAGVGPMEPGDRVEVEIEGIGTLRNTVLDA